MSYLAAVIVLAAGQGTCMKSALPKVVHPLSGLSMIGHALHAAHGLDPEYLVIIVRYQRDVVAAEIERMLPSAIAVDRDGIPGTGRIVQCDSETLDKAAGLVSNTIVVIYGNVPLLSTDILTDLVATHEGAGHAVTTLTSRVEDPTDYGRIICDASGTVTAIAEQRDTTPEQVAINKINAGIYTFDVDFLCTSLAPLGTDNDQGEVHLADVLAATTPAGRTAGALELTDYWQSAGANDRVQLVEFGVEMNRQVCEIHMHAGVTIADPASTWIDVDVMISADTTVYPSTRLRGITTVGTGCETGSSAILTDAEIRDRSVVPTVWIGQGCVAANTMVTPYSTTGTLITAPRA